MKNLISKCCGSEVKIQFHKGSGAKLEYCSKCKHYCDTIEQNEEEKEEVKNCGFCWGKIENGICKRCGATIKDNEDMFCKEDEITSNSKKERIDYYNKNVLKITPTPNDWIDKVMEFVKYKVDASVWDKEDEEDLRLMLTQQKEAIEEGKVELLEEYTKFLFDHGYVDDDVFNEEPTPDKEFLNKLDK